MAAGSTVVTLQSAYLETLAPGTYTISVPFSLGRVLEDTFTILAAPVSGGGPLPDTGSQVPAWTEPALVSWLLGGGGVLLLATGSWLLAGSRRRLTA